MYPWSKDKPKSKQDQFDRELSSLMRKYFIRKAKGLLIIHSRNQCAVDAIALGNQIYDNWEWVLQSIQCEIFEWPLVCARGCLPVGYGPLDWMPPGTPMARVWLENYIKDMERHTFAYAIHEIYIHCPVLFAELGRTDTMLLENGTEIAVHRAALNEAWE